MENMVSNLANERFTRTYVDCNDSCCSFGGGTGVLCFIDYNFTDRTNLTHTQPWELGIRWTYTILVTFVAFFGNLSLIVVLCKNRLLLKASVNMFILNMACADLILTCAGPVLFTIKDTHQFFILGNAWCHLEGSVQITVMLVSVTSLAVISFDRMIGIIRPFHSHLKQWKSLAIIISIWIIAALFATPFGYYRVYSVRIWSDLTQRICSEESDKLRKWWIVVVAALTWIPQCIMILSYTSIFIYLQKFNKHIFRKEHPAMSHLKKRVIRMMFLVVMGVTLSWLPFQALMIFSYKFVDEKGIYKSDLLEKQYQLLVTVSQYMIYSNCAFNPIVYGLMHQNFKRAFKITFPCFFNRKSPFVLTPGNGPQSYVWSLKSTAQDVYGDDMLNKPRSSKLLDLIKRNNQMTPSAVVSSSATVAAIALDPSKMALSATSPKLNKKSRDKSFQHLGNSNEMSVANENKGYVPDMKNEYQRNQQAHIVTYVIEEEKSSHSAND